MPPPSARAPSSARARVLATEPWSPRACSLDECSVGADAEIVGAILGRRVEVGDGAIVAAGSVIGEGARVEAGAAVAAGARVAPGDRGRAGGRGVIGLEQVRAVDSTGQLDDVLALPDHLRDALWRVESAALEPAEARGLVVCGMGGSAIGGTRWPGRRWATRST